MSRTKFYSTKKRIDGKRQYRSFVFPTFEERSDDIVIEINGATKLDVVANNFFDDPTLWWVIAVYNNINEPSLYVKDRQYLRIPNDIQTVYSKIKELN